MRAIRSALIVDDEAERRVDMAGCLAELGIASEQADGLEAAIRRLQAGQPDLVVCDMILPDPPRALNAALRGYLAVCYALALPDPPLVVQASSLQRWRHPGALLSRGTVRELADIVLGGGGGSAERIEDGGCPWRALKSLAGARPGQRAAAVWRLAGLPVVERGLAGPCGLWPVLQRLEDAAEGRERWRPAVAAARLAFFPGSAPDAA